SCASRTEPRYWLSSPSAHRPPVCVPRPLLPKLTAASVRDGDCRKSSEGAVLLFGRPGRLDGLCRIGEYPDGRCFAVLTANQPCPRRFDLRAAFGSAGVHRPYRKGLVTQVTDLGNL